MTFHLKTQRLVLRLAGQGDAAFILELMNEPAYIKNIGDRGVRTVEGAQTYIEAKFTESYQTLGFGFWIVETGADATPIGICGFIKRDVLENPDLGFAYLERYWSQGFGYESAVAVLEYGRHGLGFSEVFGVTSKGNLGSIRLLEKLGFTRVRTVLLPGYREESLLFALNFNARTSLIWPQERP